MLAVEEINAAGGVLGKKIEPVSEDGASDWPTFAEKAEKLIKEDRVAAVFGCWTSASRKAVKPVFEKNKALLFYPVQYEGLEQSPVHLLHRRDHQPADRPGPRLPQGAGQEESVYLVGSDYVFPRTANKIIKAYATANGMTVLGEDYAPLGSTEFGTIVNKVKAAKADAVFNTLNGDSNVAFFKEYKSAGLTAASMPVVSVSIAEEEVKSIGTAVPGGPADGLELLPDHPGRGERRSSWPRTRRSTARTSRPATRWRPRTSRSTCGRRWSRRPAPSTWRRSRRPPDGITFDAPEGLVTVDGTTQHIYKTARIGKIGADGLIDRGVELRQAGQARPVPQGLPLGHRPVLTDRHVRAAAARAPATASAVRSRR